MEEDPEIQAMSTIADALSQLDDAATERVLRWARDRYAASSPLSTNGEGAVEGGGGIEEFASLSDLFDAATPSTQAEKALVASFWAHQREGAEEVDALTVNKALKQLGHGIGNITRAFGTLQSEKPALALQVRKAGSTKQARKKYKVTQAGTRRVRAMVSGTKE
jgi:hypothetical protein